MPITELVRHGLRDAKKPEAYKATTVMENWKHLSGQRVFGYAQWRKIGVKISSDLAHDWAASIRDAANSISDAGPTRSVTNTSI